MTETLDTATISVFPGALNIRITTVRFRLLLVGSLVVAFLDYAGDWRMIGRGAGPAAVHAYH